MKKQHWVWLMGSVAVLLLATMTGLLLLWTPSDRIVRGVSIGPIEVGRMTLTDANARLEELLADQPASLRLTTAVGQDQVNRSELLASFDLKRSLNEAAALGRGHGLWNDLRARLALRRSPVVIPLYPILSEQGLASLHHRLTELFGKPSRVARFAVRGDTVDIVPSQDGRELKLAELRRAIELALTTLQTTVVVPLQEIKASPSTEELGAMGVKEKVTEFSSTFNLGLAGRVHNVKAAAQAIDGKIIAPKQVFSFNEAVGPADASDGYQEAIIISNGEFTTGVGGGVCQVSSTLYGAVLRANLTITERHNHSLIVTYVPPALDATVSYPYQDFRFENSSASHIMIKAETSGDQLTIRLYGQRDRSTQVQVESRIIETYPTFTRIIPDETLPLGYEEVLQNGSGGYLATAYRKIFQNGQLIQTEKLSQDYYSPSTRVVRAGTKPVEAPVPPPKGGTPSALTQEQMISY